MQSILAYMSLQNLVATHSRHRLKTRSHFKVTFPVCFTDFAQYNDVASFQALKLWTGTQPHATRRHQPQFIYSHAADTVHISTWQTKLFPKFGLGSSHFTSWKKWKWWRWWKKKYSKKKNKKKHLHEETADLLCWLRHYKKKHQALLKLLPQRHDFIGLFFGCFLKGPI